MAAFVKCSVLQVARALGYQHGGMPDAGYHSTVVAEFKTVVGEFQIPSMPKIVTTEAIALLLAA